jgi:hypothetical protein
LSSAEGPEVAAYEDGDSATPPPGQYQPAKAIKRQSGEIDLISKYKILKEKSMCQTELKQTKNQREVFKVKRNKRSEEKVQMLGKKVPKLGENVGLALAYEG